MEKEELQELFCRKITLENQKYKKKALRQRSLKLFEKVYEIDCMLNIYELLLEMSPYFEVEELKRMLVMPNLHKYFYDRWLMYPDSYLPELQKCLQEEIKSFFRDHKTGGIENRGNKETA